MTSELTIRPVQAIGEARSVADACKAIVLKTTQNIQGKEYVKVEGWMAIAIAHGCCLSAGQVSGDREHGYTSIGEVKRIADGVVLATAEGFVGADEKMWRARPEFACRAMAQTRAMSRAARSAFAHVVVLMDAGLGTTPAEEMMAVEAEAHPMPAPSPQAAKVEPKGTPLTREQQGRVDLIDRLFKATQWFLEHGIDQDTMEKYVEAPRAEWGESHLAKLRQAMTDAKSTAGRDERKLSWELAKIFSPDSVGDAVDAEVVEG